MDVNENLYAPYFPDFAVRGSVKENSRAGTSVLTVSAKDDDKGRDGVLRYSVRGGSGLGTFTIDEDTGVTEDQSETLIMQSGNPITLHAPCMGMLLPKNASVPLLISLMWFLLTLQCGFAPPSYIVFT